MSEPQSYRFDADGGIPNSPLPLVIWPDRLPKAARDGEAARALYRSNGWTGTWVYTVYPFWHFHTQGHEVLACVSGTATIGFGGDAGIGAALAVGDVCIIPAGVGHRRLSASDDFRVAGGYPPGQGGDIVKPGEGDIAEAISKIAALPLPTTDPVSGIADGVIRLWTGTPARP